MNEKAGPATDLPRHTRATLLEEASRRAAAYLDGLETRQVSPLTPDEAALSGLEEPLTEEQVPPDKVLEILDEVCSPATMAMAGPRFFGFVIGGSLPVTVAANWLATAWDQNAAFSRVTPGAAVLERAALKWLIDLLGLPQGCGGGFVTGATILTDGGWTAW